ncbi:MAG: UDP-N-acetylmuramoyl-L-alanyl-D-glutamate--2,6-diaminopimelate ligase [Acidobacteria bacterium]|nr:UDP-N-acetylmuramoyl-L-alanyl-D-glutamate--2,6-diaminopimelate ligase [Acidobacteriota bacterium]
MTVAELLRDVDPTGSPGERPLVDGHSRSLNTPCLGVTHDSRHVKPGWVFVALRGLRADGADFAAQAIAAGAAAVVAEREKGTEAGASDVPWVVVPDARLALSGLAASYFGHPSRDMRVVGITGTNGKTTTSYLVASIFEAAGTRCGLLGTVAYRTGAQEMVATNTTPEAPDLHAMLRQMVDAGCGACAMEVSSHGLALRRADSVHISAAMFTNLTRDHLDFHGDMDRYFAAKARLFDMLPAGAPAAVNTDDPRGAAVVDIAQRPVTYAVNRAADVTPGPLSLSFDGVEFDARTPQGTVHVRSALVGRPNVYNILAAVGVTAALGVPLEAIERGVTALRGVPGRFERASSSLDDVTVVVDYAHTDDALRNLLEVARPLAARRLITVFGAGGGRDRTKRPLMGMVAARLSDLVCITSDNPRNEDPHRIIEEVNLGAQGETRQRGAQVLTIVDRGDAIRRVIGQAEPGDVVLIAGRGHEKYQQIGSGLVPFDDVVVAREALDARRLRSRVG